MGLATGNSPQSESGKNPASPGRFGDLSEEEDCARFVPGSEFRPRLGAFTMLVSVSSAPCRGPGPLPARGADHEGARWRTVVRSGLGRSSAYAPSDGGNLAQSAPQGSKQGDHLAGRSRFDGLTKPARVRGRIFRIGEGRGRRWTVEVTLSHHPDQSPRLGQGTEDLALPGKCSDRQVAKQSPQRVTTGPSRIYTIQSLGVSP